MRLDFFFAGAMAVTIPSARGPKKMARCGRYPGPNPMPPEGTARSPVGIVRPHAVGNLTLLHAPCALARETTLGCSSPSGVHIAPGSSPSRREIDSDLHGSGPSSSWQRPPARHITISSPPPTGRGCSCAIRCSARPWASPRGPWGPPRWAGGEARRGSYGEGRAGASSPRESPRRSPSRGSWAAPPAGGWASREGDVLLVALLGALEPEEVVVAATRAVGILAAHARARLVHGATALFLVEEHAGGLEYLVLAMAQHAHRLFRVGLGVALLGHLVAHAEMAREPVDVAGRDLDLVVRAAVRGTLRARVAHANGDGDRFFHVAWMPGRGGILDEIRMTKLWQAAKSRFTASWRPSPAWRSMPGRARAGGRAAPAPPRARTDGSRVRRSDRPGCARPGCAGRAA